MQEDLNLEIFYFLLRNEENDILQNKHDKTHLCKFHPLTILHFFFHNVVFHCHVI